MYLGQRAVMGGRHVTLVCIFWTSLMACNDAATTRVAVRKAAQPAAAQLIKCTTDLTATTWDGEPVRVCDPEICKGARKMPLLEEPPEESEALLQQRRPKESWRRFLSSLREVDGWLVLDHIWLPQAFT